MSVQPQFTAVEKMAGRVFRSQCETAIAEQIEQNPPDYQPPYMLKVFRHSCPRRNGISTALVLKEVYTLSPTFYVAESDQTVSQQTSVGADTVEVPAGRFGYISKTGKCSACGEVAQSPNGRIVDAYLRPPVEGRAAR